MKNLFLILCMLSGLCFADAQTFTANQLLEKSIKYHDPEGEWPKAKMQLHLTETRPNGSDRKTVLLIDNRRGDFLMEQDMGDYIIRREVSETTCHGSISVKNTSMTEEPRADLSCERCKFMRNYYTYLWGLPMKLKDPGTRLDETVQSGEFQENPCYVLKVNYDEAVGKDVWYFYLDKSTFALIGYRFYHDETKNDGEYIVLEAEKVVNGFRLPKKRSWFVNADDAFLGADILER